MEEQEDNGVKEKEKAGETQEKSESENAEDVNGNNAEQVAHKINLAEDDEEDAKYLFENMTFEVREEDQVLGSFTVDIRNLREEHLYQLSVDVSVETVQFYPDYYLNEEKELDSLTRYPFNPAFVFEITKDDSINTAIVGMGIEVLKDDDSPLKFE